MSVRKVITSAGAEWECRTPIRHSTFSLYLSSFDQFSGTSSPATGSRPSAALVPGMRHDDERHAFLPIQFDQRQLSQCGGGSVIERASGFIGEQELRTIDERADDGGSAGARCRKSWPGR